MEKTTYAAASLQASEGCEATRTSAHNQSAVCLCRPQQEQPSGPKVTKSAAGEGTDNHFSVGLASLKSQEARTEKAINDTHGNARSTSPSASSGIQVEHE